MRVNSNGTIPSNMFAVCNVDYIVGIPSSDRIVREHLRFLEHCPSGLVGNLHTC